jgi:ribose/xylose/arabinose/galactoside ABC-type transport system permease subunit
MARLNSATLAVYAFVAVLAALIIFGAFATPGFLTISNLSAILTSTAFVGIIAIGSTLIMLSGSLFSISLGTTTAITAILFMSLLHYGVVAAILGTLAAGTAIFALQGALVGLIGANPIIVTIGAGAIQEGIVGWLAPGDITPPAEPTSSFWRAPSSPYRSRSTCSLRSRSCSISPCATPALDWSSIFWERISRLPGPLDCRSHCSRRRPSRSPVSASR